MVSAAWARFLLYSWTLKMDPSGFDQRKGFKCAEQSFKHVEQGLLLALPFLCIFEVLRKWSRYFAWHPRETCRGLRNEPTSTGTGF